MWVWKAPSTLLAVLGLGLMLAGHHLVHGKKLCCTKSTEDFLVLDGLSLNLMMSSGGLEDPGHQISKARSFQLDCAKRGKRIHMTTFMRPKKSPRDCSEWESTCTLKRNYCVNNKGTKWYIVLELDGFFALYRTHKSAVFIWRRSDVTLQNPPLLFFDLLRYKCGSNALKESWYKYKFVHEPTKKICKGKDE